MKPLIFDLYERLVDESEFSLSLSVGRRKVFWDEEVEKIAVEEGKEPSQTQNDPPSPTATDAGLVL